MTFDVTVRVVPGKRDNTSASEIEDLPNDFLEHDSLNSASALDPISDQNIEISSERQVNKVSTSTGTSPPLETKNEKPKRTRTISTGTSPPPQNMSTQVNITNQLRFIF